MKLITKMPWKVMAGGPMSGPVHTQGQILHPAGDGVTNPIGYILPAGTYEAERIRCPLGHPCDWIVLKGTKMGAAETYWLDFSGPHWGLMQVTVN